MNNYIKNLIDINAIRINTKKLFTWASGIKSPIYIDNRLIISFPEIRSRIEKGLSNLILKYYPSADFLVGVATSGIPHCAYVSEILKLPMGYVRSSKKDHGKCNLIEGEFSKAKNIVVIEDLFSTGKSSLKVVEALNASNYNVIGVISIFSYDLDILKQNFKNISYYSLITIKEIIKENDLDEKEIKIIDEFLNKLNNVNQK